LARVMDLRGPRALDGIARGPGTSRG